MKSSLCHTILPGLFLAIAGCLVAPGFSTLGRHVSPCLAGEVAQAAPAVPEIAVQSNPVPETITATPNQTVVTREQMEELFREFVLKKTPWKAEDLVIGKISFSPLPALPSGRLSLEVTASPHERFVGDVSVIVHFYVDGKEIRNMRISGKVELYREVMHSVRAMKRNEVITEADIQSVRANIAAHPERYVMLREQVIGKRLLSGIGPNQPISPRDLDQPSLVKRGDPVTIVYQQDGIRLSTKGEAKENGGQGDRIRIRNLESKKHILCQIIDPQTVEVLP